MTKKNDYAWDLDYVAHGTAHLSKNWTKDKQKEYNHWYYINKIKNAITGEDDLASYNKNVNDAINSYNRAGEMYAVGNRYARQADKQTLNIADAKFNKDLSSWYYKDYSEDTKGKLSLDTDTPYWSAIKNKVMYVDSPNKAGKKYRAEVEKKNKLKKQASDAYKRSDYYMNKSVEQSNAASTALNHYQTKTLKGISEKAISSGKSAIDKALSSISSTVSKLTKR